MKREISMLGFGKKCKDHLTLTIRFRTFFLEQKHAFIFQ